MKRRFVLIAVLLLVGLNTWSGLSKIMGFLNRYEGERHLGSAELNEAYERLTTAASWEPGDSPTYVLIGRVIMHAQANGLPLEPLEGHNASDMFGVGFGALAHGIVRNPSDAWAWSNLATVYEGYRSARVRVEIMRRAGERASGNHADDTPEETRPGLDPEDVLAAAGTMMARAMEPGFCFYADSLAKLYWDRGLIEDAGREIEASFALSPRLGAHAVLEYTDLAQGLGDWILKGIDRAGAGGATEESVVVRARAEMLERLGRNEEAITAFKRLREEGGAAVTSECDLTIGKLEQAEGRFRESIVWLTKAVEADAEAAAGIQALYYLGVAHARTGEEETAVEYLRRFLVKRPDSAAAYWTLAETLEDLGRPEEAESLYVAVVRRYPDNESAYERVIEHLSRRGKIREALAYAEGLRKVSPGGGRAEHLIRELRAREGQRNP